jgi:hypothetical protein
MTAASQDRSVARGWLGRAVILLSLALLAGCATTQGRYSALGVSYAPLPESADVDVFRGEGPTRLFVRVSRLDVHLERTHFIGSGFDNALPELKRQARLSGAVAIIDIQERRSQVGETRIYHVTATGVRYLEP